MISFQIRIKTHTVVVLNVILMAWVQIHFYVNGYFSHISVNIVGFILDPNTFSLSSAAVSLRIINQVFSVK